MNKIIIFTILLGAVICFSSCSAATHDSEKISGKSSIIPQDNSNYMANYKSAKGFTDKGAYKWIDQQGHKCYYTWNTGSPIKYTINGYRYNPYQSFINMYYYHDGYRYYGSLIIKNVNRKIVIYRYGKDGGGMFLKDSKSIINSKISAATYATKILRTQFLQGKLVPYLKFQSGPDFFIDVHNFKIEYEQEYYESTRTIEFWDPHIDNLTFTIKNNKKWTGNVNIAVYTAKSKNVPLEHYCLLDSMNIKKTWYPYSSTTSSFKYIDLTLPLYLDKVPEGYYFIVVKISPSVYPYEEPHILNNYNIFGGGAGAPKHIRFRYSITV